MMNVLVACEFSGTVRDAFIRKGHNAVSCDLLPTESEGPHYQGDVFDVIDCGWDLMIAHPPCTYLSVAGAGWLNRRPERKELMKKGAKFFKKLLNADIPMVAVENPTIFLAAKEIIGQKETQVIEPYYFGEPFKKRTCLWLRNLPLLEKTNEVEPTTYWVNSSSNYRNGAKCLNKGVKRDPYQRAKTFQGIANAMVDQWGCLS